MDYNQLLAQQQAAVNQAMQLYWTILLGAALIQLILFGVGCWVIYMFYARLRDIANEVRKLRVAYEAGHTAQSGSTPRQPYWSPEQENPFAPAGGDAKYMPKH
ncbi:MAG TPA: hypothetical protein P5205_14545 [Candidatus Paceibacterota bacterium]|nr:hypothetical protein [Verrucomicrobiota bacterium]HSA11582.1 hypothetical protein [Candidatus Paceibacterota bacterium]